MQRYSNLFYSHLFCYVYNFSRLTFTEPHVDCGESQSQSKDCGFDVSFLLFQQGDSTILYGFVKENHNDTSRQINREACEINEEKTGGRIDKKIGKNTKDT